MAHQTVVSAVAEFVPITHMEWPLDTAPALPWACYYLDRDYPICAEDAQVATKNRWVVELYERNRDKQLEREIRSALMAKFTAVRVEESYVENDNMLLVTFTFYEIEGEQDDSH